MNGLKEAFSRENLLKDLNFFALLNLGLVLTAVGIVYFKNPNHFAFGGTSGLSILLADLFPHINVGGFMWIINLVLVVLGFIFLGIKCMGWTIYSSFALSFFVSCCEWLYPSGVSMSGDAMLDLVFAVFLPALGAAIVFDIGASTGGTDIVALILAKYTSMEIGKALMVSDILIVLAAASTMRISLTISALPISMEVYLARISATMSVPPVDAPMSNTMAAPSAGRNTANTRSSMASPLMDTPEGYSHSQQDTKKESAKEE